MIEKLELEIKERHLLLKKQAYFLHMEQAVKILKEIVTWERELMEIKYGEDKTSSK